MMNTHLAEKTTIALVSGESAAIGIVSESCVAGPVATFMSDDGSGQRAFPIEIEVRKMSCPRCQYTFPLGFYCTKCGYVPTGRGTDASNEHHESLALPGERANTATFFHPAQRPAGRPYVWGRKEVGTRQK